MLRPKIRGNQSCYVQTCTSVGERCFKIITLEMSEADCMTWSTGGIICVINAPEHQLFRGESRGKETQH